MDSMQILIANIYASVINFYHSGFFLTIKILLGIYTVVLFLDLVLLLIQKGLSGSLRETLTGMNIPSVLTMKKSKARARWKDIKKKLKSENENEYKVAIIEADDFIGELVAGMDYPGSNFGERLDNVPEGQLPNIEGMKEAHAVRNRIIHDDKFVLKKEDVEHTLAQYEEFLRNFQIVD